MPIYLVKVVYEGEQFMKVRASTPGEAEEIALATVEIDGGFTAYVQYLADSED